MLKLRLKDPEMLLPDAHTCDEAASRGMETLIINHLREKNQSTVPNRFGLPKSNYYADAAKDVEASASGNVARVEITKPGITMHYEGGTVYPKKKALAMPISPAVAEIWPSEYTGEGHQLFKTPGGALGDAETGEILYILLPKATIPADKTVLPSDDAILGTAEEAIWEMVS